MMAGAVSRRAFLRGRANALEAVRPPWAVADFTDRCGRCAACAEACPAGILVPGDGGFPVVDFHRGACDFCRRCAEACPTGALDPRRPVPWQKVAALDGRCLSLAGVACRICGDFCAVRAITFPPVIGGAARPRLEAGLCTGCGACVAPCPAGALEIGG